ncbi:MAG: SUMF1/EgtB/PvdO family nonheme iron enzyme [Chloroflexi bacterium]|nr:SUMF1/EgtB/PvdO family nonheme iron enzyme [Chloroflexota bacterium]
MSKYHKLSRREFLSMAGVAVSAAALGACASPTAAPTLAPTVTLVPPEPTPPIPEEIKPIVPEMVLVEAGSFEMGSMDGHAHEQPVHTVNITRSFYIAKYEVTYEEYDTFCQDTSRYELDDRGGGRGKRPIIGTDWHDAVAYCNWLSEKEGLTPCYSGEGNFTECDFLANGYRLPTEAEWEYAARGGPKSQGYIYAGSNDPDQVAWYDFNSDGHFRPVGQKEPNELGVYDMSGNMFEWCWDWYVKDYYVSSPTDDPLGPDMPVVERPWDLNRVRRSGSWRESSDSIRVAYRSIDGPTYPGDNGFRLVRTV